MMWGKVFRCIGLLILAAFAQHSSTATSIAGVWLPDEIVIAADSCVTFGPGRGCEAAACKVHYTRTGQVYAYSGLGRDQKDGFDPDRIIAGRLETGKNMAGAMLDIQNGMRKEVARQISLARSIDRAMFDKMVADGGLFGSYIIGYFDNGAAHLNSFDLKFDSEHPTDLPRVVNSVSCPGDTCRYSPPIVFQIGAREAMARYLASMPDGLKKLKGGGMALDLVNAEIIAKTWGVGGPVNAVRAIASGASWLTVDSEVCPSE